MGRMVAGKHDRALRYIDHGYAIFEATGNVDRQAVGHLHRGMIEDHRGNFEAAGSWYRRSLEVGRNASKEVAMSLALVGMAADHHRRHDDETAAVILETASATQEQLRYSMAEYLPNSQLMGTLKRHLGEEVWLGAEQRAATLTLDDVIDLALS